MGRVLALDFGARRTGVAVSDLLRITARPLTVLESDDPAATVAEVGRLIADTGAEAVVVGLPLLSSGDRGDQAQAVMAFAALLEAAYQIPIHLWDESYSTVEVHERRRARGERQSADWSVDAEAAAIILESWLEAEDHTAEATAVNQDPRPATGRPGRSGAAA